MIALTPVLLISPLCSDKRLCEAFECFIVVSPPVSHLENKPQSRLHAASAPRLGPETQPLDSYAEAGWMLNKKNRSDCMTKEKSSVFQD
ncbi:hypothetical protein SB772_28605 [Paraburkholderia sp. SIMBA_030]